MFSETNECTLASFLLHLNKLPRTQLEMGENIISIYLSDFDTDLKSFEDLNKKLRTID